VCQSCTSASGWQLDSAFVGDRAHGSVDGVEKRVQVAQLFVSDRPEDLAERALAGCGAGGQGHTFEVRTGFGEQTC